MHHIVEQNERHKTFLRISSAFNTGNPQIPAGKALRDLKDIIDNTGPLNPLHFKAVELRDAIIQMDNSSRAAPTTTATILAFPQRNKK